MIVADVPWKATHIHKKGGIYRVINDNVLDSDDLSRQVVYDDGSGRTWVRSYEEFMDGRFKKLPKEKLTRFEWFNDPVMKFAFRDRLKVVRVE